MIEQLTGIVNNPRVLSWAAIFALFIALYQAWKARSYEKRLNDLNSAVTSFEYLRNQGLELYRSKKYTESYDTFKKYYLDNEDGNDLHEIINLIFWEETKSLYGENISHTSVLIVKLIMLNDSEIKEYNSILIDLVKLYKDKFNRNAPYYAIPYFLSMRNYEEVNNYLEIYKPFSENEEMNRHFRQVVFEYCKTRGFVNRSIYANSQNSDIEISE